ncbi:MAG: hypothetical protein HQL73_06490 [Magnetococcales bacterium]|nr:hypothetical protein [Magnetococcales bacterium]
MEDLVSKLRSEIISEYERDIGVYKDFAEVNLKLFEAFVKENAINVYSINSTVMGREALIKSLTSDAEKISNISDINDLVCIKVVTFFDDDAKNISRIINDEFKVVIDYSVRPETRNPRRFGYQSRHYVTRMIDKRLEWIEYRRFTNLRLNIEVKSLLQHAWTEFQTQLFSKGGVPENPELLRAFSRVIGVLEIADRELKKIKTLSHQEKKKTKSTSGRIEPKRDGAGQGEKDKIFPTKEDQTPRHDPATTTNPGAPAIPASAPSKEAVAESDIDFSALSDLALNDQIVRRYDREIADMYEAPLEYRESFIIDLSKISLRFKFLSLDDLTKLMLQYATEIKNISRELLTNRSSKPNYVARGLSLSVLFYIISSLNDEKELTMAIAEIIKTYGD